ncbi:hypothetical protein M427DRAFT_130937 [Gonapodya prolifera JEL478]|uniref:C3H1-type domain-containing protein n=1 Tax=Gonapodya prolifera (strain JEL478) TaxID=1344416 RepID=A0A139AW53_GONPJ|nr:hypothetical protein M427DRAFT_130937 [Gonapodya prolifera JEL478]|eukprot:KXS20705.1 hypothetical protein M427DRAFT_130937 [Gonapodya prolifera JEL478]
MNELEAGEVVETDISATHSMHTGTTQTETTLHTLEPKSLNSHDSNGTTFEPAGSDFNADAFLNNILASAKTIEHPNSSTTANSINEGNGNPFKEPAPNGTRDKTIQKSAQTGASGNGNNASSQHSTTGKRGQSAAASSKKVKVEAASLASTTSDPVIKADPDAVPDDSTANGSGSGRNRQRSSGKSGRTQQLPQDQQFQQIHGQKQSTGAAGVSPARSGGERKQQRERERDKDRDRTNSGNGNGNGSTAKQICQYFAKGSCAKGPQCPYIHDSAAVDELRKKQEREEKDKLAGSCKYFRSGKCDKGANCPYSHDLSREPCKFYHWFNKCSNPKCRYSHDPLTEEERRTAEIQMMKTLKTQPCKFFHLWNSCKFSADPDKCPFSHDPLTEETRAKLRADDLEERQKEQALKEDKIRDRHWKRDGARGRDGPRSPKRERERSGTRTRSPSREKDRDREREKDRDRDGWPPSKRSRRTSPSPPYRGSRPGSPIVKSRPGSPHRGSRPGSPFRGSRPGSPYRSSRPPSPYSFSRSRPGSPYGGPRSRPMSPVGRSRSRSRSWDRNRRFFLDEGRYRDDMNRSRRPSRSPPGRSRSRSPGGPRRLGGRYEWEESLRGGRSEPLSRGGSGPHSRRNSGKGSIHPSPNRDHGRDWDRGPGGDRGAQNGDRTAIFVKERGESAPNSLTNSPTHLDPQRQTRNVSPNPSQQPQNLFMAPSNMMPHQPFMAFIPGPNGAMSAVPVTILGPGMTLPGQAGQSNQNPQGATVATFAPGVNAQFGQGGAMQFPQGFVLAPGMGLPMAGGFPGLPGGQTPSIPSTFAMMAPISGAGPVPLEVNGQTQ